MTDVMESPGGNYREGKHRTASQAAIAREIRTMIFNGELRPYERVPQARLAKQLGMSRIPLREVLVSLAADGWLTLESNRGAIVNPVTAAMIDDQEMVKDVLYTFVLERAAANSDPEKLMWLQEASETVRRSGSALDSFWAILNLARLLFDMAGTRQAWSMLRNCVTCTPELSYAWMPDSVADATDTLPQVAAAVIAGDAATAIELYRLFHARHARHVLELFEERRGLPSAAGLEGCPIPPSARFSID